MGLVRWGWARSARYRKIATAILLFALSLAAGAARRPLILVDDAAITLRYAERLAGGRGPTYNDHERVQGFSNPLLVGLLAAARWAGADLEAAAYVLCALAVAVCVVLVLAVASRLGGTLAGLLACAGLLLHSFFVPHSLQGMESALGAALGLAAIHAIQRRRLAWAGLALGLALVNKLDAALLAVPVLIAISISRRRFPWALAGGAAVALGPWLIFAWAYFGGIVPRSLLVKLGVHGRSAPPYDWIVDLLGPELCLLLPAAAVLVAARGRETRAIAASLAGWLVLHALACSLLDLGGRYPWYTLALYPPLWALAACGAGLRLRSKKARFLGAAITIALLAVAAHESAPATWHELRFGRPIAAFEAFEEDRRLAGIFVDQYAAPGERVESAYGWVAYESRRPFDDVSLLNSRTLLGDPDYIVTFGYLPGSGRTGYVPLATFDLASHTDPGLGSFFVLGRPSSAIARRGLGLHRLRAGQFPPPIERRGTLARVEQSIRAAVPSSIVYRFDPLPRAVFRVELEGCGPGQAPSADFEILLDGERVLLQRAECGPRAAVQIPIEPRGRPFTLELSVTGPDRGSHVYWRNPSLGWGEGAIDLARVPDPRLRAEVARHFPVRDSGSDSVSD
ncbi:MAG: hypothetical protein IT378_01455 [Sandaracinaceae bacterium]|nr:hypothetical protein [Sandaracinaceae bacterium]